jgi:hypothetical protein
MGAASHHHLRVGHGEAVCELGSPRKTIQEELVAQTVFGFQLLEQADQLRVGLTA